MQIGVYGSGYLATVISACLADFGTPVCCCHTDNTRIMEIAKGNVPFFEKNLGEVIRRNVRAGRLVYSVEPEELASLMDPHAHTGSAARRARAFAQSLRDLEKQ